MMKPVPTSFPGLSFNICKTNIIKTFFVQHHLQTKMAIHDIVATTYYLENYDRSKINLEVIVPELFCQDMRM